jgi:TPP-dependent trihydroxycyclohexane-1,2-dione (THcHDO) dehydratase
MTVVPAASEAVEVLTDRFTTGVVTVTLAEPVDEQPEEFVTVTI